LYVPPGEIGMQHCPEEFVVQFVGTNGIGPLRLTVAPTSPAPKQPLTVKQICPQGGGGGGVQHGQPGLFALNATR
jgi:hypothetical protein